MSYTHFDPVHPIPIISRAIAFVAGLDLLTLVLFWDFMLVAINRPFLAAVHAQSDNKKEPDIQLGHSEHYCGPVAFCDHVCCDQVTNFVTRKFIVAAGV